MKSRQPAKQIENIGDNILHGLYEIFTSNSASSNPNSASLYFEILFLVVEEKFLERSQHLTEHFLLQEMVNLFSAGISIDLSQAHTVSLLTRINVLADVAAIIQSTRNIFSDMISAKIGLNFFGRRNRHQNETRLLEYQGNPTRYLEFRGGESQKQPEQRNDTNRLATAFVLLANLVAMQTAYQVARHADRQLPVVEEIHEEAKDEAPRPQSPRRR